MAHAEVPPFHNPLERLGHTFREIPVWMGRHWKSLASIVVALGGAGYVSIQLARPYTPDTQNRTTVPVSDPFKPTEPGSEAVAPVIFPPTETPIPPTATATTAPKPPESTAIPTVEFLPDVINNKTANLVDLSPSEIQKIVDQAKAKGETVIALPDWVKQDEVEITQFRSKVGTQGLVITAPNGKYELPALTGGKISALIVGPNHTINGVGVSVGTGQDWFITLPPSATTNALKIGQEITIGQTLLSFDHDPGSKAGQIFQNFLKTQIMANPNNPFPENTLAIIGLAKTNDINSGVNLGFPQLAKDNQNNVAVISNK